MRGYDYDGVLSAGVIPQPPFVVVSGRTWAEGVPVVPQATCVVIRGTGAFGDRKAAGQFKATMCAVWELTEFWEDDPLQAAVLRRLLPALSVHVVGSPV